MAIKLQIFRADGDNQLISSLVVLGNVSVEVD